MYERRPMQFLIEFNALVKFQLSAWQKSLKIILNFKSKYQKFFINYGNRRMKRIVSLPIIWSLIFYIIW